jgi:hypothetical protein
VLSNRFQLALSCSKTISPPLNFRSRTLSQTAQIHVLLMFLSQRCLSVPFCGDLSFYFIPTLPISMLKPTKTVDCSSLISAIKLVTHANYGSSFLPTYIVDPFGLKTKHLYRLLTSYIWITEKVRERERERENEKKSER